MKLSKQSLQQTQNIVLVLWLSCSRFKSLTWKETSFFSSLSPLLRCCYFRLCSPRMTLCVLLEELLRENCSCTRTKRHAGIKTNALPPRCQHVDTSSGWKMCSLAPLGVCASEMHPMISSPALFLLLLFVCLLLFLVSVPASVSKLKID